MHSTEADPCLFRSAKGDVWLLVYVDDALIMGREAAAHALKARVQNTWECSVGDGRSFTGLQITRDRGSHTITLAQTEYVRELARKYGLSDAKPRSTPLPMLGGDDYIKREGEPYLGGHYAELVGALLWVSNCTRPDVTQAVNLLARYMSCPTEQHWVLALGVLRYLNSTSELGLCLGGDTAGKVDLITYCDADYAGDIDTRRSTTGYVVTANGTAVSWQSKLQPTVARSTTEAEYMAAASAVSEALCIRKLDSEFRDRMVMPMTVKCDSQGALAVLKNPGGSSRTKHIDVLHHFARERVLRGDVIMDYIPTAQMVADAMTKALPVAKHTWCREHMGMMK